MSTMQRSFNIIDEHWPGFFFNWWWSNKVKIITRLLLSHFMVLLLFILMSGIIGNILTIVSFLIGTSSFILGLRIQSSVKKTTTTASTPSSSTLPSSLMNKYFELLILALVIPSIVINIYGILLVGSHLYPEDTPFLLILFAL